ncbi:MAG: hypothetical protein E6K78_03190 [Candidatus Eisenbacteria bacterium]|uniref:Mechanosensitive ion channel n=1 Tax=Eiseniibacteriota bacterium TaxID=2212470 RepID=A0A538TWA0_UNCEI|nr:MAG: hypothetical protein E6K78_03190 [Candidatus Eisenbacteria bacterium]
MPITVILQFQPWDDLLTRVRDLGSGAGSAVLNFLLALVVTLVGWSIARITAALVRVVLRAARFNEGVRGLFGTTVLRHEPAGLASWAVYWAIFGVALMLAVDTLGFNLSGSVGERLGEVLPRIIAAAVLLAVGVLLAMLLGGLARRFFETAGLRGGRLRGQIVTAVLSAFAVLLALEQLGFAAQFIMVIGMIGLAAVGLALGLAFGLGCRDLARDFVVEYLRSLDEGGGPTRPS